MALQHLRSSTANKRPIPSVMSAGQLAVNTNEASPGLFFKDSNGDLVKVGPVHIGANAPNSSPDSVAATALVTGTVYQILVVGTSDFTLVGASANTAETVFTATGTTTGTGTVSGQQGNEKGEMWLDNTGGNYVLKIYDGTAWRSEAGEFVNVTGDTMTGDLVFNNADIVFEGSTADAFETTLTVVDPTADRTITLPNVTGTVVTTGDTGSVTSTMITDGTIVNADVNASAAIAGTKISPDFGSQNVLTTGNVGIGTSSPSSLLHISSTVDTALKVQAASAVPTIELLRGGNTGFGTDSTYDYRLKNEAGKFTIQNGVNSTISDLLTINNIGNVGIGTTSPSQLLDLASTAPNIRLTDTVDGHSEIDGNAASLKFNADKGNAKADSTIIFAVDNSEKARILSTGGITFNGDTANANALDDYEEGVWTPAYAGSTTNPTLTYDIQGGRYVKIGRVVHCEGRVRTDAASGGSGNLQITGLPFTSAPESTVRAGIDIGNASAFATYRPTEGLVTHNSTQIVLFRATTNSYANITVANLGNTTNDNNFQFSLVYMAAA